VREAVFYQLGGFRTDKSVNGEDWEFVALLALRVVETSLRSA
jgi:hypothetical protein